MVFGLADLSSVAKLSNLYFLSPIFNTVFSLLRLIYTLVVVCAFYLVLIFAMFYVIGACIVATVYLYSVYRLGVSLL